MMSYRHGVQYDIAFTNLYTDGHDVRPGDRRLGRARPHCRAGDQAAHQAGAAADRAVDRPGRGGQPAGADHDDGRAPAGPPTWCSGRLRPRWRSRRASRSAPWQTCVRARGRARRRQAAARRTTVDRHRPGRRLPAARQGQAVGAAGVEQVEQARDGGDQGRRADQHGGHQDQRQRPVRIGLAARAGVVARIEFLVRHQADHQRLEKPAMCRQQDRQQLVERVGARRQADHQAGDRQAAQVQQAQLVDAAAQVKAVRADGAQQQARASRVAAVLFLCGWCGAMT